MKFCDVEISFAPTRNWNIVRTLTLAYLGAALVALLSSGIGFWLSGSWLLPGWFLAVTAAVVILAFADAGWIIRHGYFSGWIEPVDAIGKFLQKGWSWAAIRNFSQEKQARYHRGLDLIEKTKENIIRDGKRDWIINLIRKDSLESAEKAYRETRKCQSEYLNQVREVLQEADKLRCAELVCQRLGVKEGEMVEHLLQNSISLIRTEELLALLHEAQSADALYRVKEAIQYGGKAAVRSYIEASQHSGQAHMTATA